MINLTQQRYFNHSGGNALLTFINFNERWLNLPPAAVFLALSKTNYYEMSQDSPYNQ